MLQLKDCLLHGIHKRLEQSVVRLEKGDILWNDGVGGGGAGAVECATRRDFMCYGRRLCLLHGVHERLEQSVVGRRKYCMESWWGLGCSGACS